MNSKKRLWNCLLAAFLIAALLLVPTIPALALDGEPLVDPMETVESPDLDTEPPTTPPEDTGEGNDTPADERPVEGPESGPVVVSTLEALLQAIDEAEAGATIGVDSEIVCPDGTTLGNPDYRVTIQKSAPEGRIYFSNGDGTGTALIQNITFDGACIESFWGFMGVSLKSTTFINCDFINIYSPSAGTALAITDSNATLIGCTFDNNKGEQGAHIRIDGEPIVLLENCTFTNGAATMKGGAIMNCSYGEVTLDGCTITGNTAKQCGGGIYNVGYMTIQGCKIYGNTVDDEPNDIANEYYGRLALMDDHAALVSLYEEDGLIPNLWAVDVYRFEWDTLDEKPNMVFSMTFAADPEPEEADPTPEPSPDPDPVDSTPEPEPTPTPTPDPEPTPTPSRPSGGYSRPSATQEPEPEDPKEITLTNGKAVLKAPEALYWAGYKDSRGGGAEGITRADLAFLIASMMDQESRDEWAVETAPFDDVAPDAWYAAAIGTMENTGIMVGCGNGIFAPDRPLTWGELITVFSRFTGEGEAPPEVYTGQHWAKDAINTAIALGWVEYSEAFDPGGAVTCGEMVDFIQVLFLWASD